MRFDELEWVREVIDRWLTENAPTILLAIAAGLAMAMFAER